MEKEVRFSEAAREGWLLRLTLAFAKVRIDRFFEVSRVAFHTWTAASC